MMIALLLLAQDVENNPRFHAPLLEAAKKHEAYGRVDDVMRFAPTLCDRPPDVAPRLSKSQDGGTHGRKLYYLYAWDAGTYLKASRPDDAKARQKPPVFEGAPAEQVLIKQSWTSKDGKPGERTDLFLMLKLGEKVEGSDRGWVYGTVTPDGRTVTSAGRVKSCMDCHEKAGDSRLFGLPK